MVQKDNKQLWNVQEVKNKRVLANKE